MCFVTIETLPLKMSSSSNIPIMIVKIKALIYQEGSCRLQTGRTVDVLTLKTFRNVPSDQKTANKFGRMQNT